jgi:hypothetical protein
MTGGIAKRFAQELSILAPAPPNLAQDMVVLAQFFQLWRE